MFLRDYVTETLMASAKDAMATLNHLTSYTMGEAFRSFVFPKYKVQEVVVSGGGARNKTLMDRLASLLDPVPVISVEKFGIPLQAKEPLAFAFYGLRCMQNKVNHIPACTGAKKACVLGSVTKP